ncbi:hypothetical protein R3P38DRAFT_2766480 [Favolaschia claudopus]|uniref:Uncharacterized protein n=1 Tax=Favolaschia claudopus TaxID=2862362 RepID=A0AAW0D0Z5_9AGAR
MMGCKSCKSSAASVPREQIAIALVKVESKSPADARQLSLESDSMEHSCFGLKFWQSESEQRPWLIIVEIKRLIRKSNLNGKLDTNFWFLQLATVREFDNSGSRILNGSPRERDLKSEATGGLDALQHVVGIWTARAGASSTIIRAVVKCRAVCILPGNILMEAWSTFVSLSGDRFRHSVANGPSASHLVTLGGHQEPPSRHWITILLKMSLRAASKLDRGLTMLLKFSDLENLNVQQAARVLAIIVAMYIDEPGPPLDPRYKVTAECFELLKRKPDLHVDLKRAHASKSYDTIRNSVSVRRPDTIFPRSAESYLDELKVLVKDFVNVANPIKLWKSELTGTDLTIDTHLESLGLLGEDMRPLMILQDLGSFIHDPILSSRVDNLFVRGKNTVLVNTSGSGKSRLTFEGLCHNWGLYFTVTSPWVRDLGSQDITTVIETLTSTLEEVTLPAHSPRQLEKNHTIAERCISRALLARLLVFRIFLETAKESGLTEDHKKRWLMLQLSPFLGTGSDVFQMLAMELGDFSPAHEIASTLVDIQEMLGLGDIFHLFLVLDEGQATATKFDTAFDPEPGKYPLLRKIIDSWEQHFPDSSMSCVIAGTNVPKRIFDAPEYADRVRWTSDTGSFDDPVLHERYLRRFLPPTLLETESGTAFLRRAWAWTRGRHRYAASLILQMLMSVLNNYIEKTTHFRPTDGRKWIDIEKRQDCVKPRNVGSLNFQTHSYSSLGYINVRFSLRDVVYHYAATNQRAPLFTPGMIEIVSSNFGRFVDGGMKDIVFDEPIALVGATVWMTEMPAEESRERGMPFADYLLCVQQSPPSSSKAFAACLAFYFSRAFASNPTLSEIFTFADPVPAWAAQSAKLVELHGQPGELRYSVASGDSLTGVLATSASSLDDVVSWLEHTNPDRTPFCLPQNATSPDLVFYLKLQDGSYLSIVMRVSAGNGDDENLLGDLEEQRLFCDDVRRSCFPLRIGLTNSPQEHATDSPTRKRAIELLNAPISSDVDVSESTTSSSNTVPPRVLHVIAAFEKQIDSDTLMPTGDAPPYAHAVLSKEMFEHLTATVSPETFVQTVARNVLKRRHDSPVGEGDVDREDTGEERGTKRRKSMPVESGDDAEETKRASEGRADAAEAKAKAKSKTAAGSGTKRTRTARSKKAAGATKAASEAVKEHEDVAEAKPKKAARPRGKKAPVSASKKVADAEETAGGSRGKKAPASGSKKIVDAGDSEVDGHEGAAVGKIKSGGARGEQSQTIKAGKAEASHPVDEAETSGRMTLRSQTRREKALSESHASKEESSKA